MAAFDNLSNPSEYLAYWGKTYRNELLSNILPFWMKYGLDKENGGYFTCVDRDGTLIKQGRFNLCARLKRSRNDGRTGVCKVFLPSGIY